MNKVICRDHYPLPTTEDAATQLYATKMFTVLDVHKGCCHVELDNDSSYLTTFNTPFGQYWLKEMPFGICSAPEVCQKWMHQLIKGLCGVEVVVDDFVLVGFRDTAQPKTTIRTYRVSSRDVRYVSGIKQLSGMAQYLATCQRGTWWSSRLHMHCVER